MREFDILEQVFSTNPRLGPDILIPPGDDLAMVQLAGRRLLAGVDQLIAGRHVNLHTTPIELVARKAIARSVSDIAAMAGRPVASLVAAVLPPDFGEQPAKQLAAALRQAAEDLACPLIGGDLAFHADPAHPLVCSVTVLAEPATESPVTRSGAQVGDSVFVTGRLGGAVQPDGGGRHLTFTPRVNQAVELAQRLGPRLHAMIDLSDGLGRDASHIAARSGGQIVINAACLPCSAGCDWKAAMSDGEDYELCFTAESDPDTGQGAPAEVGGVAITKIGRVVEHPEPGAPRVLVREGENIVPADELGWQHES